MCRCCSLVVSPPQKYTKYVYEVCVVSVTVETIKKHTARSGPSYIWVVYARASSVVFLFLSGYKNNIKVKCELQRFTK